MIEIPSMIIVVRAAFHEYKKCYPQVFSDNVCRNYRPERNEKFIYFTCFLINYHFIVAGC